MRWVVEVSSIGKADLQKFCVEAESWQRALQAARAQRGEEGPMSGFSIELLEEGYRAVDPVGRLRFVVKRAPDDLPVTAPLAKDNKGGVPPSPPSSASGATPPKSSPPRPADTDKPNGPAPAKTEAAAAPLPAIGSALPGLPRIKLLSSRAQDPTDASPLTYREYSFAVPPGTTEATAVEVLRGQLKIVDGHLAGAKMGKLVNLAVFDVEFTGKPPAPPIATLSWKDWKGEPVVGYPRRSGADKQVKPPGASPSAPPASFGPPSGVPASFPPSAGAPASIPPAPGAPASAAPIVPPSPATAPIVGQAAEPPAPTAAESPAARTAAGGSVPPPPANAAPQPMVSPSQPPPAGAGGIPVPVVAPVAVFQPGAPASFPPPPATPAAGGSVPPPAGPSASAAQPALRRSSPDAREGLVRTPSGRFVRGRTTGDELITALFESMHDLHFLRDALDGGQFCLALATEVLPARVALIHFFDVEKREWVIACTRGKDTARLLTMRTPENDEHLREAARKRRAVVMSNAESATAHRYQSIGGTKSMIIAPIMQAGRALGALEIINPLDGMPFTEDEGNAMTYIAEQFAEYLGSRGIVLDPNRIQSAATPG